MALTAQDVADVVATTLYDLGPMKMQQIGQARQYYEVYSKWFKKDKVTFESGQGIQRTLMNRVDQEAAAHVGYTDPDSVNIVNVIDQLQIPWRHLRGQWGLIYQTDILMNSGKALVLNVIKPRRLAAMLRIIELIEDSGFSSPSSSSDKTEPFGIKYWVVKNNTTGFNGGAASGHTTVGGVDLSDSPTFKNYSAQYTTVSKTDMIKKWRTAHRKCRFISPITVQDYRGSMGERYRNYVNETTISVLEDVGEAQNMNLGRDVASMDGQMTFKRSPIMWVPKLDDDTTNPVYMIDHSTFYPVVLKGDYLREGAATPSPLQHNTYQVFVDLSYNILCVDRRRNAVLATDTD